MSAPPTPAEAIARLRETLNRAVGEARDAGHSTKGITVRLVVSDDLRALLDRAALLDEALDALEALEDACASVASWSEECLEFNDPTRAAVRAVLTKSGRR